MDIVMGGQLPKSTPTLTALSDNERALALKKFNVIKPYIQYSVPLSQIAEENDMPISTIRDWIDNFQSHGLAGLVRRKRSDLAQPRISERLLNVVEGLALKRPRLSIKNVCLKTAEAAEKLGERIPSYSTVYRIIQKMDPALLSLVHEGSEVYRDTYDLVVRMEATSPNAIWQADHTQLDIFIKDGAMSKKPWLTIILDDYSRAVAGYALSFNAPSAIQTALALRQAIWRKHNPAWSVCGIPEALYTDHGTDVTSCHIEQVAADLKIRLMFSAVAQPRGRGKIERFFRTVSQVFLPCYPGYAPPGTTAKAVMTLEDLAAELERYLIEYNNKPHSSTKMAPQARWGRGSFLPRMADSIDELDLLLLTVPKTRLVRPDGIHFEGLRYISPILSAYIGEQVTLRYDPRDMAEVRVFHKGLFICKAICQELAGQIVPLREIKRARDGKRRGLRKQYLDKIHAVDELLNTRKWEAVSDETTLRAPKISNAQKPPIKLYNSEE